MATHTLSVTAVCPTDPLRRDECSQCLRERLGATPGVRRVTLNHEGDGAAATLELDYDPRLMPLNELQSELTRAGMCCQSDRASVVLGIDGMASPRQEKTIEAALAKLPAVVASASFASKSLGVEFDRSRCALPEIARRLDEIGLRLRPGGPVKPQVIDPTRKNLQRLRELILAHHKLAMAII